MMSSARPKEISRYAYSIYRHSIAFRRLNHSIASLDEKAPHCLIPCRLNGLCKKMAQCYSLNPNGRVRWEQTSSHHNPQCIVYNTHRVFGESSQDLLSVKISCCRTHIDHTSTLFVQRLFSNMTAIDIPKAKLGKYGPSVPAQGFGLMSFAGVYGKAKDDEERFKVLDRALELGNTFWDSSKYLPPVRTEHSDTETVLVHMVTTKRC